MQLGQPTTLEAASYFRPQPSQSTNELHLAQAKGQGNDNITGK